ncbi:MAG: purine-nucleoside phosphorylase, partial [Candidatus Omnitrophica bacterium]|nr:purine-nucleoside phosphorylase [Candidatus Omnitrophota bacterium]
MDEFDKVVESVEYIKKLSSLKPDIGIILGTGLDKLAEKINKDAVIPYKDIPHFPVSTVKSHTGNLVLGELSGKNVVAMQGRFHLYEGYSALQIALPIRVMKLLGIKTLIESNAAGGLNPLFSRGDLVIITDHINLMGHNPLIGYNDERFGPRFPDMSMVYDQEMIKVIENTAIDL